MADKFARALLNKALGLSRPTMTLYPLTTGVPGVGAALLVGAGAWGLYVNMVPNTIAMDFWLVQLQFGDDVGAVQVFDVQLYNTTLTTTIFQTKVSPTVITNNVSPVNMPFPIYCAPLTQVQGRAGGAAAKTINTSVLVATGI